MSENSKKYILNYLTNPMSKVVKTALEDLSFSIETTFDENVKYEFVLVNNADKELPPSVKVIYFGDLRDKKSFFEQNGVAILSDRLSDSELIYFNRLLGENSTLDVADSFNSELRALGKIKVTDHLNSGFYCDSISVKAAEEGFDFFNIKRGIFNLFNFISELILDNKGEFPIDVDFGVNGESFFLQSHFPIDEFYGEVAWNSLNIDNSPLSILLKSSKIIDIYVLEKSHKLVITVSWNKKQSDQKSLYIHGIESFRAANRKISHDKVIPLKLDYEQELGLNVEKRNISKLSLSSVHRIVKFLKKQEIDLDKVTLSNITDYLSHYPNQEVISNLGTSDKENILKVLQNIEDHEKEVSLAKDGTDSLNENLLQNFLNKIEHLDPGEANEIVSLGVQDHSEETQRVSGWIDESDESVRVVSGVKEDIGESSQLIKGNGEDLDEDSITIKGTREDIGTDSEKMHVKSLGNTSDKTSRWGMAKEILAKQLKESIKNNEIEDIDGLKENFSCILQKQINISQDESIALVTGILEDSIIDIFEDHKVDTSEVDKHEFLRLRDATAKKDTQISRMMKLIDAMKKELLAKSSTKENETSPEISKLKKELEQKVKQIEILKLNTENLVNNYNSEKTKTDSLEHSIVIAQDNNLDILKYKEQIKTLEVKLEDSNQRSEILNTKLEKEKESSLLRSDNDTIHFREKMMKSQQLINTFQKENKQLANEVKRLIKAQAELSKVAPKSVQVDESHLLKEKTKEAENLTLELKKEGDQLKAFGLKVKQLEQKNKFLLAQVNGSTKGKNKSKNVGNPTIDAKSQHKIKHLEKLTDSFKAEAENAKLELAEKKKEILKFKQEANLLKLKVSECERKLSINKKNAA